MLVRYLPCTVICASSLLACAHATPPHLNTPPTSTSPSTAGYLTIAPDVSVSRSAAAYEAKQEALDPNANVMAEILAIPPGR